MSAAWLRLTDPDDATPIYVRADLVAGLLVIPASVERSTSAFPGGAGTSDSATPVRTVVHLREVGKVYVRETPDEIMVKLARALEVTE